jgi:hypothetical protein
LSAVTRYARAQFIASHIPVFRPLLPPPRKIWNSEDARMSIFDAAALVLTFFDAEAVSRFEAAKASVPPSDARASGAGSETEDIEASAIIH